jgi:hypothetical protein
MSNSDRVKMKITGISAYRVELPLHKGSYNWSGGKAVSVFDSTVVAVTTTLALPDLERSVRWDRRVAHNLKEPFSAVDGP